MEEIELFAISTQQFQIFSINKQFCHIKHPCEKFNTSGRESLTGRWKGAGRNTILVGDYSVYLAQEPYNLKVAILSLQRAYSSKAVIKK